MHSVGVFCLLFAIYSIMSNRTSLKLQLRYYRRICILHTPKCIVFLSIHQFTFKALRVCSVKTGGFSHLSELWSKQVSLKLHIHSLPAGGTFGRNNRFPGKGSNVTQISAGPDFERAALMFHSLLKFNRHIQTYRNSGLSVPKFSVFFHIFLVFVAILKHLHLCI